MRKWRSIVMGSAVLIAAASAGVTSAPGAGADPGCKQNVTVSDLVLANHAPVGQQIP